MQKEKEKQETKCSYIRSVLGKKERPHNSKLDHWKSVGILKQYGIL